MDKSISDKWMKGHLLLGHDEVQQGPELLEGVLQRRPCDEEPVVGAEVDHRLVEERVIVL